MEHQPPDCIIKAEAIGCCENCAKKVRKKIARLEGVQSVEINREKKWVYISGDVEPRLLMDYLTRRMVKPQSVKLIYYCSKEARNDDDKYHAKNNHTPMENKSDQSHVKETHCHQKNIASDHAKNQTPMENKSDQSNVKETHCHQKNMASDHAKNHIPMENKSDQSHVKETYCNGQKNMANDHAKNIPNNDKKEGENYNQDSSSSHHHHHQQQTRGHYDPNHYAPRKDWVHKAENYVAQPQKQYQYQYPSGDCECRNPSCDFHAWKRQGTTSHFDFDAIPREAGMRSASARWFTEASPHFYGYDEPFMLLHGQFPFI